ETLLLGLQFDAGAQHVDARDDTLPVLIDTVLIKRLRRRDSGADRICVGDIRNHQKIGLSRSQHHQVAIPLVGKLRCPFGLRRGLPVLDVGPIDLLRVVGSRVGDAKRSHNRWQMDAGNIRVDAQSSEVNLLEYAGDARGNVWQHCVQSTQTNGLSRAIALTALDDAEVVFQGPFQRIPKRKIQYRTRSLASRYAPQKRTGRL